MYIESRKIRKKDSVAISRWWNISFALFSLVISLQVRWHRWQTRHNRANRLSRYRWTSRWAQRDCPYRWPPGWPPGHPQRRQRRRRRCPPAATCHPIWAKIENDTGVLWWAQHPTTMAVVVVKSLVMLETEIVAFRNDSQVSLDSRYVFVRLEWHRDE